MEDEILDYNWVISKEVEIADADSVLLQKFLSDDALILGASILKDNEIYFHVKNADEQNDNPWKRVNGLFVHKDNFENAKGLLEMIYNEDVNYPNSIYKNYSKDELLLKHLETDDLYRAAMIKIELKRRGYNTSEKLSNIIKEYKSSRDYKNLVKARANQHNKNHDKEKQIRAAFFLFVLLVVILIELLK